MANLVYKHGGTSLCYKHGGTALCFKGAKAGNCTVQIDWVPATWICQTYNVEHNITFTCNGAFTTGTGTISKSISGTSVVFTLSNISRNAIFTLTFSADSGCSSNEDPGVKANFVAAQSGAAPQMRNDAPVPFGPVPAATITVTFDGNGKLSGIS